MKFNPLVICIALIIGWFSCVDEYVYAQDDLTALSLEDLMNVKVTSVSKHEQSLKSASAAIYVLTQEDVRRSSARSIPELLRLVPGLHVASIDAKHYAISSRGNNSIFANKLLVLIDGRTVYTPLFSGVYWESLDTAIEDIDRIEVIRGPGAALWGANAVNGVINIITKSNADTTGSLLSAGGGTEQRAFGTYRYGEKVGNDGGYRFYVKSSTADSSRLSIGGDNFDEKDFTQAGVKSKFKISDYDLTLQGDLYHSKQELPFSIPSAEDSSFQTNYSHSAYNGGNFLSKLERDFNDGEKLLVQFFFDRFNRSDAASQQGISTYDLDSQYSFKVADIHEITTGISVRTVDDNLKKRTTIVFNPSSRTFTTAGTFVQDDISLSDAFTITVGTKFEHNQFTGSEWQPNARAIYEINKTSSVWASVARAVVVPSRAQEDVDLHLMNLPTQPLTEIHFQGSSSVESEKLLASEVGFRTSVSENLSFDVALFYNHYTDFVTYEQGVPSISLDSGLPHVIVPLSAANEGKMNTVGGELVSTWQPLSSLRIQGIYSYLHEDPSISATSTDTFVMNDPGLNPSQQFGIKLMTDLPNNFEADGYLRYVDSIPNIDVSSYLDLDLRLAWRKAKDLEISLIGTNLLHDRHEEYISDYVRLNRASIERGVYAKVTWRF